MKVSLIVMAYNVLVGLVQVGEANPTGKWRIITVNEEEANLYIEETYPKAKEIEEEYVHKVFGVFPVKRVRLAASSVEVTEYVHSGMLEVHVTHENSCSTGALKGEG